MASREVVATRRAIAMVKLEQAFGITPVRDSDVRAMLLFEACAARLTAPDASKSEASALQLAASGLVNSTENELVEMLGISDASVRKLKAKAREYLSK